MRWESCSRPWYPSSAWEPFMILYPFTMIWSLSFRARRTSPGLGDRPSFWRGRPSSSDFRIWWKRLQSIWENCGAQASRGEETLIHSSAHGLAAGQSIDSHPSDTGEPVRDNEEQRFRKTIDDGSCQERPAEALRKKVLNGDYEILLERLPASYEHGQNN